MLVASTINSRLSCFNVLTERAVIWVCLAHWFHTIICLFRPEVSSFLGTSKHPSVNDKDASSLLHFEENDWYFTSAGFGVACNMINETADISKKTETTTDKDHGNLEQWDVKIKEIILELIRIVVSYPLIRNINCPTSDSKSTCVKERTYIYQMRWTAKKVGLHKKPTITDTTAYSEFF